MHTKRRMYHVDVEKLLDMCCTGYVNDSLKGYILEKFTATE